MGHARSPHIPHDRMVRLSRPAPRFRRSGSCEEDSPLYFEANEWRGTQSAILRDVSREPKLVAVGHLLAE